MKGKLTAVVNYREFFSEISVEKLPFSLQSVTNLFSWNKGGIHGIFLSLGNLSKTEQYLFGLVDGFIPFR